MPRKALILTAAAMVFCRCPPFFCSKGYHRNARWHRARRVASVWRREFQAMRERVLLDEARQSQPFRFNLLQNVHRLFFE